MKTELVHHNLSKKCVKRLTELIKYMETVPTPRKFNMGTFYTHAGKNHRHPIIIEDKPITAEGLHRCGTSACALGWAATNPKFMRQGLAMIFKGDEGITFKSAEVEETDDPFEVARSFFDMEDLEYNENINASSYLFGDHHHEVITPKDWVERARYFIQTDGCVAKE